MTGGEKRAGSPVLPQDEDGAQTEPKKLKLDITKEPSVEKTDKHGSVHVKLADSVRTETTSESIHGFDEAEARKFIEALYGVDMPQDFFDFWDFCCRTNPMNPRMALSSLDMELIGPFDILAGDVNMSEPITPELRKQAMLHYRFFYDVPEFQSCLKISGDSLLHYGYYRKEPNEKPIFIASNDAGKDCLLKEEATNLFALTHKIASAALQAKASKDLEELVEVITLHADKFKHPITSTGRRQHHHDPIVIAKAPNGIDLLEGSDHKESFEKKHHLSHAGIHHIIADYNESGRNEELHEKAKDRLKELEQKLEADRAEGNFGTSLELGLWLFCSGNRHLTKRAAHLMAAAYKGMNRLIFAEIIEEVSHHRNHGNHLHKFPSRGN